MKPSDSEVKEFWEWCGIKHPTPKQAPIARDVVEWWLYPDGDILCELPPIDLNNIFLYAAPKLGWFKVLFEHVEVSCDYYVTLTDFYLAQPCKEYEATNKDPALALFWTIYSLIKEAKHEA